MRRAGKMAQKQLKVKFNKVKRRIELGVNQPGDIDKFKDLSKQLGYANYLGKVIK